MIRGREVWLTARPVGLPKESDFAVVEVDVREPGEGEVLVRNTWMSIDPSTRLRMHDLPSYLPPFELNHAVEGNAVGVVVRSNDERYVEGDVVRGSTGWRDYHVAWGRELGKIDPATRPRDALGILGGTGFTAYVGVVEIGKPVAGETWFVSGAAGGVGTVAGQILKLHGCRVIGSAGSDEKVRFVEQEVGLDAAFNYKREPVADALARVAPDGFEAFFDNVGADHLEAALDALKHYGRIVSCGSVGKYNDLSTPGPRNMRSFVTRRLSMRGFVVFDYFGLTPQFFDDMREWMADGRMKTFETITDGLENAPRAFISLLSGGNTGKALLRISDG